MALLRSPSRKHRRAARTALVAVLALMFAAPLSWGAPGDDAPVGPTDTASRAGGAQLVQVDSVSAVVEVPPQDTRVLRVDHENVSLVPVDWVDPVEATSSLHRRAVDRVEPWLKRDLAVQLNRMGSNGNRYAQLIVDCSEADWLDEIAFTVAHTPPEVLNQVGSANVLRENAQHLYEQDSDIGYADLVERTGEDGSYTTVSYVNYTGVRQEYPRDIYYYYVAHARVFWEDPAKVSGKSFWRKAYWDEIQYNDSGTLKSWLAGAGNIVEAANVSTLWMQMNMEFGYGTNPLQPVSVILERYGSCGQYSITTAASLKVAMIPARVAIYPASDHQWCEVYIDGHWMHLDASNDVAGQSTVKEPHLIRRTNTVNFNDAGVFERGWKPYMAAMSAFRSDDVIINSIDISAPDPSFTFRESGMTERVGTAPHMYTETSTVTINVLDAGGDPVEGAWVGVFRVGHDIYNPDTKDYPHFAYANYTNATGQAEFELGLQGYCNRCGEDHYYAALVLSRYNQGTNDFHAFAVPEENREYSFTYTVTGDADPQEEPSWTKKEIIGAPPDPVGDFMLNVSLESWGRQRHTHGEWGQYEVFGFRTSFDHLFPSDVDVLVVDEEGLRDHYDGNPVEAWMGATDAEAFEGGEWVPHDEATYLLLSNTDSHYTTKVVNVTVDLSAMCRPRLALMEPVQDSDHSTGTPLVFSGNLTDHIAITGLDVSLDAGANWTDLFYGYDAGNGTFGAMLNTSDLPSGEYHVILRATNEAGVEERMYLTVFLDADDPELAIDWPPSGAVRSGFLARVGIHVTAGDNRELVKVEARVDRGPWQDLTNVTGNETEYEAELDTGDLVGTVIIEVRATDGVGRTTSRTVDVVMDAMMPSLELASPEHGDVVVIGPDEPVDVICNIWDDNGISHLAYRVDGGELINRGIDPGPDGMCEFFIPTTGWEAGEHQVEVLLADLADHVTTKGFTVVIDGTPPSLSVDGLDPYYDDRDDVELVGTVTDEHDVEGLWVSVDGGEEEQVPIDMAGGFSVDLPSGSEAVGEHSVDLRTADVLGNEVTNTHSYEVVDETGPQLTLDTPATGSKVGRGKAIHISGTASDNVAVTEMALRVGVEDTRYILENLDPGMGLWSIDVGTAGMDLGQLVIEVRVEDAAGNMAVQSVIVDVVDRTDPTLDLTVDPLKLPKRERGKLLVVPSNFSDDVAVTKLEYRVDGWAWIPVPCQFPCQGWNVEVPTADLSTGNHVLEVRATDSAGNEAIVNTPFEVEPVPDEPAISAFVAAGIVIAVVVALLLVYFLVLRKGPATGEVPTGDVEVEPGPEPEPEPTPEVEPEPEPEPEPMSEDVPRQVEEMRPEQE